MYSVPCRDCNHVYIGETGRTLKKRLSEHKQAIKTFNSNNGISVHVHQEQHRINWEDAKVLDYEDNYWKRRTLEATCRHIL